MVASRQGHFSLPRFPVRSNWKSLGAQPWPGAREHPQGHPLAQPPPACPDLPQTLRLACQHLLPASSLPQRLFVFLLEPSPPMKAVIQEGGVLETSLCPLQPHHAPQPWRVWRGRLGPWRAGSVCRQPGFRQLLAPGSAGGIWSRRESSPCLSVLGRGSGSLSAYLGPSPCSLSPRSEESGRIWVRAPAWEGFRPCRSGRLPGAPGSGASLRSPWAQAWSRQGHLQSADAVPPPSPILSLPVFYFHLVSSSNRHLMTYCVPGWGDSPCRAEPHTGRGHGLSVNVEGTIGGQQEGFHDESWVCSRPP